MSDTLGTIDTLGMIGTGMMGGPMAQRLLDAGFALAVHDPDPRAVAPLVERGALAAASAREVADRAGVVFACLPAPAVSLAVALDAERGVAGGSAVRVYVEMSTIGSETIRSIAAGLAPRGVAVLDAPVSGGPRYASSGRQSCMVSGDADAFERAAPALRAMARSVFVVGARPGMAQIAKLVNNAINAAAMSATCEAVALGVKAGLDPAVLVDVINASTGRNSTTQDKFPQAILPRTFDYGARLSTLAKDVRLFRDEAERHGVPLWVVGSAVSQWGWLETQGDPEEDFTNAARHLERWAGVRFESPGGPAGRRGGGDGENDGG